MAGGVQHFQRVNEYCDRRRGVFPFLVIRCTCSRSLKIADSDRSMGFSRACRAFAGAGWRVAAQRADDQCPQCVAGFSKSSPRPASSPAAPAKPKVQIMVSPAQAAPAAGRADPPRQPTPKDRLKIQTALAECYDDEASRYRGSDCDQALAERLDVPRAWIAEERERAYGPDRCEADGHDLDALKSIVALAGEVSAKHLELAATAENLGRNAKRLADKLAARGVK